MLVLVEDLERLISFPRVRELNGRIRISKSGLFLGDHATSFLAINMDTNPWLKSSLKGMQCIKRGSREEGPARHTKATPRKLLGIKDL